METSTLQQISRTPVQPGRKWLGKSAQLVRKLSVAWLSGRLAIIAALTIFLSFSTQGIILAKFGLSLQTDAFFAAIVVPQILFDVFATALSSVLVPTLVDMPLKERQRLIWTYLHLIGGLLTALCIFLSWTASSWTSVLLPGLPQETQLLTATLARICLASMVFSGISTVVASYCRSRERFAYPEVCTAISTLAGLATLLILAPTYGIVAAAIGVVVRSAVEMALILPSAGRFHLPQFGSPSVRSSLQRMKPILISSCYQKTDMLIDRMLASLAPAGSITVLAFTRQVFHAAARLMNKAIATPLLQRLSVKIVQKDIAGYWTIWRRSGIAMFVLSLLGICAVVALGDVVLAHLLRDQVDTHRLWVMFLALGGVLIGEPLVHLGANAFYAFHDTKTPAKVSVFAFTLGIAFRLAGFFLFGVIGIGIGLSGYYLLYAACLMFSLRRAFRGNQLAMKNDPAGDTQKKEESISAGAAKMRVLCVIPGLEEQEKSMPFVRRQVASLHAAGVEMQSFYLGSRTSPWVLFSEFSRFRKLLREFNPDLVHAQFGTVTGLFTALATWRPAVMSCRGSDMNPAPGVHWWRNRLGHLMSQLAALRMRRILCVSQKLRERLWWRKSHSEVIPNGVDFQLFQPISQSAAREKLQWDLQRPIVLFNARTDPIGKRQDLAEGAVRIAQETYPDLELVVLRGGVPPQEMPLYYSAADCLLMTSDHEGSPNVVKESLACQLPVVSVDVGDVRERIQGVFPSFLAERDPQSLAEALVRVLAQAQRSNGREIVSELEEKVITQRVIDAYQKALGRAA